MRHVLRARHVQIGLVLWSLGLLAGIVLAGASIPTFNLFRSGFSSLHAALLLPTVTAVGTLALTTEVGPAQLSSARRVPLLQATAVLTAVISASAASWLALSATDPLGEGSVLGAVVTRNLLILVGLGLIARRVLGAGATMILPVGYVLIAMLFGDRSNRTWDVILAETAHAPHLLLGAAILTLGLFIGCGRQADRRTARA